MQSDFESAPQTDSASRQKKVAEIISAVLPRFNPRTALSEKISKGFLIFCIGSFCYLGGYLIGENFRTLNYSEKVILSGMIEHTAKAQNHSEEEIKRHLIATLGTDKIKNIRAYQWKEALMVLGQYIE